MAQYLHLRIPCAILVLKGDEMYQLQKQVTKPQITAHLAQTMTLLTKSIEELNEEIEKELASNPALEMIDEVHCPTCNRILPRNRMCPECTKPKSMSPDETIVFISPRNDFLSQFDGNTEEIHDEQATVMVEELPMNVLRQIAPDLAINDRQIAAYLLNQLNEDGLLPIDLNEAANYFHTSLERIKQVQRLIQHADPLGVGSGSPQEALLIQIEVLSETKKIPEIAKDIVKNGFDLMCKRQYRELAKIMGLTQNEVVTVSEFIGNNLNPYPGRAYWGDERQPGAFDKKVYMQPDVLISHLNNDLMNPLMVEVILPVRGTLQINPIYKQAIKQSEGASKEEMKEGLEKASLFIKCLQQRNNTMQRLMEKLVAKQRQYLLKGDQYLKPITRAELSKELNVHESTISRAVANKSVQLPNGQVVPMSKFFERSLNVRSMIKEIIINESKPLSDTKISRILKGKGITIARRTVAKYRAVEGILPTHLRKNIKN